MRELLSGALVALFFVAALFFRKFGRRTRDRFFDLFAAAFLLMAANSALLGLTAADSEHRTVLYGVRLVAFLIIIGAIWHKNRPES